MARKQPIRIHIKKVIEALKETPKTWTQLKNLGIPDKTLQRVLQDYLMYWGLVKKEGQYYIWFENAQTFNSKHEYELAINHSRQLIPALKNMLNFIEPKKDKTLYLAAKEHLKSYPETHMKLVKLEQIFNDRLRQLFAKYKDRMTLWAKREVEVLQPPGIMVKQFIFDVPLIKADPKKDSPEEIKEMRELQNMLIYGLTNKSTQLYKEFAGEISLLILKIQTGEPLKGKCFLCPKVRIKETTR